MIRKDYLLDKWVIIAPGRAKRPRELVIKRTRRRKGEVCPFCPGNESMTPPATLMYVKTDKGLEKVKDSDGKRRRDWLVRCFPNLYPAVSPLPPHIKEQPFQSMPSFGLHHVLIESPFHREHPGIARLKQLRIVVEALIDEYKMLSRHDFVRFVSIFRNHGRVGGASLSHAHMQIIALPFIPPIIQAELDAAETYYNEKERCAFCDIVEKERKGPRLISQEEDFVAIAPWASAYPYEFWILPKRHSPTFAEMTDREKLSFTRIMRKCFGKFYTSLGDPPYNFGFHIAPVKLKGEHYHWHLEVYPYLSILAGFEKSTGAFINIVEPEEAAKILRC
jgi:UDPglucose--hexose-1-phosphate uridylyltransferase